MSVVMQFVVLGLLQGLTEFLPVSSSGHLVLFSEYFGIEETLFVSIILHVATLLSICFVMRKELWQIIKNPFSKEMRNLVISSIATFFMVLLLYDFAKSSYLDNYVPFFFMLTASVLILTDIFAPQKTNGSNELNKTQSLIMGVAQGIAVFPGLSRSGATICAGVFSGANKERVAKHSFLMSIPIILASLVMEMVDLGEFGLLSVPILPLILGFVIAFLVGVLSLKFMIKLTCKVKFRYFAYYLIVLSIISLIL